MADGGPGLDPAEIEQALTAFNAAGFMAVLADYAQGGMQLRIASVISPISRPTGRVGLSFTAADGSS